MDSITISGIDDDLKRRLAERAAEHGRTPEDEARDILADALQARKLAPVPGNLAEAIRAIVEPVGGIELEPFPPQTIRDPPKFE